MAEIETVPNQEAVRIKRIVIREDGQITQFDLDHLDATTREELEELLREYAVSVLEERELLPSASQVRHSITLEPGAQLICKSPYRIPYV